MAIKVSIPDLLLSFHIFPFLQVLNFLANILGNSRESDLLFHLRGQETTLAGFFYIQLRAIVTADSSKLNPLLKKS